MIIIEHGPEGKPVLFDHPDQLFIAWEEEDILPMLRKAEAARREGAWIAGLIGYEAGYALEPALKGHIPPKAGRDEPLLCLGAFGIPAKHCARMLEQANHEGENLWLSSPEPMISPACYGTAFDRVKDYIMAGDFYQLNLTFPLTSHLHNGSALGLYGALRGKRGGQVGYGAFFDFSRHGGGPVVVSRSPELFFRVGAEDIIESRPMKGTSPRSEDPVEDMAIAAELRSSIKDRAENLMIVDLLRNDISRLSTTGSVHVPELYRIESYATVHQMTSLIRAQLVEGTGLDDLMKVLFPCGSVTGAPKIRAMQAISEIEAEPRGAYCGSIGWAAPDGRQCWSVAIRTMRVWQDGRVLLNVGGGVVYDSTKAGEWEEALWKTRYMMGLLRQT